jgi:hypothetical protein
MNPTIEIESDMTWPDKAIVCSADCDLCYIADWNEDGSPKRIDCVKEWMVDGVPGEGCPVYGMKATTKTLRLIDEAVIEELHKIIGTWTTPVDNAVPVRILNSWIVAAGLGRKDELK